MEDSSEKVPMSIYVLIGAAFIGVGALVVYFLILRPAPQAEIDDISDTPRTVEEDTSGTEADTLEPSEDAGEDTTDVSGDDSAEVSADDTSTDGGSLTPDTNSQGGDSLLPETAGDGSGLLQSGAATWSLAKRGTNTCADQDGSQAYVDYVITLTNTGSVMGVIDNVTDTLDQVVTSDMISNISGGGLFDDTTGQIVWDNSGAGYDINAGALVTFTYRVTFSSALAQFGNVENDVTALPGDGSLPPTPAQSIIAVGCGIPDTALGDEDATFIVLVSFGVLMLAAVLEMNTGLFLNAFRYGPMEGVRLAVGMDDRKKRMERKMLGE